MEGLRHKHRRAAACTQAEIHEQVPEGQDRVNDSDGVALRGLRPLRDNSTELINAGGAAVTISDAEYLATDVSPTAVRITERNACSRQHEESGFVRKLPTVYAVCTVAGRKDDVEDSASHRRTANKPPVSSDNSIHSILSTLLTCQVHNFRTQELGAGSSPSRLCKSEADGDVCSSA